MNELEKEENYISSGGTLRIRTKENCNNYFLKYLLSTKLYKQLADRESIGAVIKHLTMEDWLKIKFPLPPLNKQREITDHITDIRKQAQQLKDKTKEALTKASNEMG